MGDINGQESISVSFYNSLLGIGGGSDGDEGSVRQVQPDARQVRMPNIPSNYSTVSRLIDETDDRMGRHADQEQSLSGLTKRLAEMFEQKQALVAELKNERMKSETIESERDDLQRRLDRMSVDYDQALSQVEQSKVARERASKFMEEAKEATRRVINESRNKVADSEGARIEAERAYEDEHNLRRNLEQLLQEMRVENDTMTSRVSELSGQLRDMTISQKDMTRKLGEAEQDLASMHAENEAYASRIEHLTSRNELLARNLQSLNLEHGELRKQFDATAISHAALSADYEELMRRCTDAEGERDQLRIESISRASLSANEVDGLKDELAKARNVIILLRPIIQKAGIGDLRKGDIRLLDERLTDYENSSSSPMYSESVMSQQASVSVSQPQAPYQQVTGYQSAAGYQPTQQSDVQPSGMATSNGYGTGYDDGYGSAYGFGQGTGDTGASQYGTGYAEASVPSPSPVDPTTTADLYAAFESEVDSMDDSLTDDGDQSEIESVSFVNMFGQSQDNADDVTEIADATDMTDYDFETFEDYDEIDGFDDLDEPDDMDDYDSDEIMGENYSLNVPTPSAESTDAYAGDASSGIAFPQDLKRGPAQTAQPVEQATTLDASDDDFELENLSDFNSIMANFAHYTANDFGAQ